MLHSSRFNKWRGYKDVHTILDAGILPADVVICLDGNGGRIKLSDAKAISKVGRKVGVWGWYLTDNEIRPSMHVGTNVLGSALGKLPPEALVEFYEFNIAADKVKQMRKEGAGQDKIKATLANLPKVKAPAEWLTNLEYVSYLKKLKELE